MLRHRNIDKWVYSILFMLLLSISAGFATTQEQIRVDLSEVVDQEVRFNPLEDPLGPYFINTTITGVINITNLNPVATISDIFVIFNNASNVTGLEFTSGRNGTIVDNSTDAFTLRIFELEANQSSVWTYTVNGTNVQSPLELNTNYSDYKVLAGNSLNLNDTLTNRFEAPAHNTEACVFDVVLTQTALPVGLAGEPFEFEAASNVTNDTSAELSFVGNQLIWNVSGGACMNSGDTFFLSYDILSPTNISETSTYNITNTTLSYQLNNTVSHVRFDSLRAITSQGVALEIEKRIMDVADPFTNDSNVTWNGTGRLISTSDISLLLTEFSLWVSDHTGNPNTRDNDTLDGSLLEIDYNLSTPGFPVTLNATNNTWMSPGWLFNYSDLPSPILYGRPVFEILDDGVQITNRTVTRNGNDFAIKELFLVLGYWLEVQKNITSLGDDEYNIRIEVYNKGNQVTPENSIVTLFDFVPENFNITSNLTQITNTSLYPIITSWYEPQFNSENITGTGFNGTMLTWGLAGQTPLNTSFAQGPRENFAVGDANYNATTFVVTFNVTGEGPYSLLDVFITGVDPQQIDGANSDQGVFVTNFVERMRSTEGIFAAAAGVLLVLGLIV